MVNTGRASGACYACLKRRVKCDEEKPQCRRCVKANRACPGYRDKDSLVFRNQNGYAEEKVKARGAVFVLAKEAQSSRAPSQELVAFEPVVPRSFDISIGDQAITRFFHDFVVTSDGTELLGYMDFLPNRWSRGGSLPCLDEALMGAALAHHCKRSREPRFLYAARRHYGNALSAVNDALRDPSLTLDDDVLLAIVLLGIFEMLAHEKPPGKSFDPHFWGKLELLKARGLEQFRTEEQKKLFRLVLAQLQIGMLLRREAPPPETGDWIAALGPRLRPQKLQAKMMDIIQFSADSETALYMIPEDNPEIVQRFHELLVRGAELDFRLQEWWHPVIPEWQYQELDEVTADCGPLSPGFSRKPHLYPCITVATTWNHYRAIRIRHLEVLLKIAKTLDGLGLASNGVMFQRPIWQREILAMVNDICSSMPYLFGELRSDEERQYSSSSTAVGYMTLWPLRIAITVEALSKEKKMWLAEKAYYIGEELGISQSYQLVAVLPQFVLRMRKSGFRWKVIEEQAHFLTPGLV